MRLNLPEPVHRPRQQRQVSGRFSDRGGKHRPRRAGRWALVALLASTSVVPQTGCGLLSKVVPPGKHDTTASYHDNYGLSIEYPEITECESPFSLRAKQTIQPLSFEDPANLPTVDMTLQEAINRALSNSPVLRTVGATFDIRLAPQGTATIYDPALTAASVQGTEAALAAFDAQYNQQLFWQETALPANLFIQPDPNDPNPGFSGFFQPVTTGPGATFNGELRKTTATGASFALRNIVNYDRTNRNGDNRLFNSAFSGWLEAEWRQPLLQGAGVTYNRIAGPNSPVGQYNGVLIARINEDVSLADFETNVIQMVADVETAYWDLVTAYRVLDTTVKAREAALQTWQIQKARLEVGTGRADDEAQARSQYYQFDAQVKTALAGQAGLYDAEQQLRYLVGMVATDGALIRPTTKPTDARVIFDWESALGQALERRVEIRRQRMQVRRRELELVAAKMNYRPRLDFLGQYRHQGLADHLVPGLYDDIFEGNYQEWQAGIEMSYPVGFRAAGAAIAHAKLSLQRERAILDQAEYLASHNLSNAAREIETRHELMETNYNRLLSDLNQVDVLRIRYEQGSDSINFLLQAQRQVVSSATDFYRSLSDYNLAIRDFHREKGSLLAYNHVQMTEGPWAGGAQYDAYQVGRYLTPRLHPEKVCAPRPLTSGPFDPSAVQDTSGTSSGAMSIEPEPVMIEEGASQYLQDQPGGTPVPQLQPSSAPNASPKRLPKADPET